MRMDPSSLLLSSMPDLFVYSDLQVCSIQVLLFENYPTSYNIPHQDSDLEGSNCYIDEDRKLVKQLLHL